MGKDRIIALLGEKELLLPELVNAGLTANDRAKFLFTLLQTARWQADHADQPAASLAAERMASGLDEHWLDTVAAASRKDGRGYVIPQAGRLLRMLNRDIERMAEPIRAAALDAAEIERFDARLASLPEPPAEGEDRVSATLVDELTRVDPALGDSAHLLVMDLHKALNRLQAGISRENVDGAATYGLATADIALVRAFMQGVNRTAPLKFDHPGLATTATRIGRRLVIQNDIGTTDAHVLVITIEGLAATVTYTDVHLERLWFFRRMFEAFPVAWQGTESRQSDRLEGDGLFHMNIGCLQGGSTAELEAFLAHLGSRLVFLIDWNRARKRLRLLLPKKPALDLLDWAAANDHGHRGFLALGGERLVFDALTATKAPLRYGARLDELLGEQTAVEYLKFVLRTAAEGLLAGRSEGLIREEAKAELITLFNSAEEQLMDLAADHAGLIVEAAMVVRDLLLHGPQSGAEVERAARRAKHWESRADDLVTAARALVKRSGGAEDLRRFLEEADDAVDELEETAFLLTLLPDAGGPALAATQRELAELVVGACQHWVTALECARHIHRGGAREDLQDFLVAVDQVGRIERDCDLAQRLAKAALLQQAADFRQLHVFNEVAASLEQASDALMRAAFILRDHIMSDVITA